MVKSRNEMSIFLYLYPVYITFKKRQFFSAVVKRRNTERTRIAVVCPRRNDRLYAAIR